MADTKDIASDKTGEVDLNPSLALEKIDSWVDGFVATLPNLLISIIIFCIFLIIASLVKRASWRVWA